MSLIGPQAWYTSRGQAKKNLEEGEVDVQILAQNDVALAKENEDDLLNDSAFELVSSKI